MKLHYYVLFHFYRLLSPCTCALFLLRISKLNLPQCPVQILLLSLVFFLTLLPDVASWVVPRSEGPRFPGALLIRTRCPDPSPNSSLWIGCPCLNFSLCKSKVYWKSGVVTFSPGQSTVQSHGMLAVASSVTLGTQTPYKSAEFKKKVGGGGVLVT